MAQNIRFGSVAKTSHTEDSILQPSKLRIMKGDSLYMCTVYDFASYKDKNSGACRNLEVASNSSRQQPVEWKIEKEKINQDHAFIENTVTKKRKLAPEPIKDINDIYRILDYFLSKKKYRNLLLFTMGINLGLRCGDLLKLKFGNIMDINGNIKAEVVLEEEKTRRKENKEKNIKAKHGHIRTCYMNDSVVSAAKMYVDYLYETGYKIDLNDYLFTSLSRNNSKKYYDTLATGKTVDDQIAVRSVEDMLKNVINKKLGINVRAGTHLMRKTFAYQVIMTYPDRNRAIEVLQKVLGHTSPAATLFYAGVTTEEIQSVCKNLYNGGIDFGYGIGLGRDSNTNIG